MVTVFVIASVVVFTGNITFLVIWLMISSEILSPGGEVTVDINNGKKKLKIKPGSTLLAALANESVYLPSACGGGGTCAMCICHVHEGGGSILPTETGYISKKDARQGMRLGCQVKVRNDMKVSVPEEVLEIRKFDGTVRSNNNVATFIKELTLDLPPGVDLNFQAGGYIQIDIPKYKLSFEEFDVEEEYREDWDRFNFWQLSGNNREACFRAYSMANHPAEGNQVMLNVRIATPPRNLDVPPGVASSYMFNLKPGDQVQVSGPFGEFFAKESEREMVYIGGGAGMAPMRSHIFDLFHTNRTTRKVSYWYGARSLREMFYTDHFEKIEKGFPNFSYHVALSEPQPEDEWTGPTGFIHAVVLEQYLDKHPDPSEIEYYLCGPPLMIAAVQKMLYDLGVEEEMIAYDSFG